MRTPKNGGERAGSRREQSSPDGGDRSETIEVARYIGEMTAELEAMAVKAKLDFLAYLLGMARIESDALGSGPVQD